MISMQKFIKERGERAHPFFYIGACIIAFGVFIPLLGFYWDDWPTIFYTFNDRVAQLVNHFSYDRPFSVWAYWLVGRLGTAPISWHLAAFALRVACVFALAWALKPLWPRQTRLVLFTGLVFAIYPGYYVQPSSVIFLPHLASLALFLFSLGAMGRALSEPALFWRYTALGLAAALVQMFTVEYYVGLELIRPLYLWLLLSNQQPKKRPDLKRIAHHYAPYFAIFVAWVAWRLFLLELPAEPYPIVFATQLRADPLGALVGLAATALQDLIYTFAITWSELVLPLLDLSSSFNLLVLLVVIASAAILYYLLSPQATDKDERRTANQGMLLGTAAFLLGMFPIWAIGETIAQGDYNLRYILVGMTGAAIFVVALLAYFLRGRTLVLAISVLVALALGAHLRAGDYYSRAWEEQRSFFWQLAWRAPGFEPNTALISFTPAAAELRDPMTGNALNVLYPTAGEPPSVGLWNFELTRTETVDLIKNVQDLQNDYRGLTFSTGSAGDYVFYYLPPNGCLWMLTPLDANNDFLPSEHRELVVHSNLENISTTAASSEYPPQHIYGREPARNWCYYFEKADLARQQEDWPAVFSLMDEAASHNRTPSSPIEWLPLLAAHIAMGDYDAGLVLSEELHAQDDRVDGMLCALWDRAPGDAYARINELADCSAQ